MNDNEEMEARRNLAERRLRRAREAYLEAKDALLAAEDAYQGLCELAEAKRDLATLRGQAAAGEAIRAAYIQGVVLHGKLKPFGMVIDPPEDRNPYEGHPYRLVKLYDGELADIEGALEELAPTLSCQPHAADVRVLRDRINIEKDSAYAGAADPAQLALAALEPWLEASSLDQRRATLKLLVAAGQEWLAATRKGRA